MPIVPIAPPFPLYSVTALDLINHALQEIGYLAAGETLDGDDADFYRSKLNRIIDRWATQSQSVYNVDFTTYTLIPNHQPHTIGPDTADFPVASRPSKIEGANVVLNNVSPAVNSPIALRDEDWWLNQRVQGLASTIPTDLYYSPAMNNGQLFLWPIPDVAYGLQLETWTLLARFADLVTPVILAPGYEDALTYTLAEESCPSAGKAMTPGLVALAARARADIQALNVPSPRISTRDPGMPTGGKQTPYFNYLTGYPR